MFFKDIVEGVRRWQRINATRRDLARLTDEQLTDIGLARGQIDDVARRLSSARRKTSA